jgi:GT2 family glycosyltransferase
VSLDAVDLLVVVHRCSPEVLGRSFQALANALERSWGGTVVIVENAAASSTAAAARDLLRLFPNARHTVVQSGRNLGFGSGVNVGMAKATAPYVGVFNPDGAVRPDTLSRLAAALEDEPRGFMAGPAIVPFDSVIEASDQSVSAAAWLPGTAGLYRREAFFDVGGFDPLYFMYSEDVEIGRRARLRGWKLLRVPQARFHHQHAPGHREALRKTWLFTVSETTLSYQYAPSRARALARLARGRARWFVQLSRNRRWARLVGALVATATWPLRVPRIERRRRTPWTRESLEDWLGETLPRLQVRRLSSRPGPP